MDRDMVWKMMLGFESLSISKAGRCLMLGPASGRKEPLYSFLISSSLSLSLFPAQPPNNINDCTPFPVFPSKRRHAIEAPHDIGRDASRSMPPLQTAWHVHHEGV
jgi:hypothetical protein